jgi:hypothetical protein
MGGGAIVESPSLTKETVPPEAEHIADLRGQLATLYERLRHLEADREDLIAATEKDNEEQG